MRTWGDATGERRQWWLYFGALLALTGAWVLAAPLMTGHDESANAVRAAAVVRGQLVGERVAPSGVGLTGNAVVEVDVPDAYGRAAGVAECFLGEPREHFPGMTTPPTGRVDCRSIGGGDGEATAITTQHRHPPAYHALVGLPTLVLRGTAGGYVMRLVGAALCSALLASALVSVGHFANRRLVAVGLFAALTPEVVYLAATVNTAGPEAAASVGLWVSALALATTDGDADRVLVRRAGVALVVLVLSRPMSPLFAAVILAAGAVVAGRRRVAALARRPDVRLWALAVGVAVLASVAWLVYIQSRWPIDPFEGTGVVDATGRIGWWMRGVIGVFGSTDVIPPVGLHVVYGAIAVAIIAVGVRSARPRDVLLVVGLLVAGVALLVSGEGLAFPQTGYWWQGRYVLPILMGGLITATVVARPRPAVRWGPAAIACLSAVHVVMFGYAARHYAVGYGGTANPLRFFTAAVWSPPAGPAALYLVVVAAALAGLSRMLWKVGAPRLDLRAVRDVLASYRGAPLGARAFVAARFLIAPLAPLVEETRGLQGRMLSLGCGYGAIERYLTAVNPKLEIEGIDLDGGKVELVNATARASPRFDLTLGDATQIDHDLEFQAVLVCDALHHFPASTHAPLAQAIAAALESGGVCVVKDLDVRPRWKYRWNQLHDRIVAGPEPITCRGPGDVAALFADAGFEVERAERTDGRLTPYAHYVLRLRKR